MRAAVKCFGKICLKSIRDTIFSNMWSVIMEGKRRLNVLVWGVCKTMGEIKEEAPTQNPSLCASQTDLDPDFSIRKTI